MSFPCLNNKKKEDRMEKEEKDIRFVARFYRENRLDTTQAWQKLGIGKQRNNSILLYRLITIAAVTFLIAGFSWWWIYDRQDWIVIASSAHAVKEVTLPDNSHITLAENSALQYDRLAYGKKNRNVTLNGKAYFSVTHQEQCPFRVQTELANIQASITTKNTNIRITTAPIIIRYIMCSCRKSQNQLFLSNNTLTS